MFRPSSISRLLEAKPTAQKPKERERETPTIKTAEEIAIMREAGRVTARALQAVREAIRPGISTLALNDIAETVIRDHGAVPCFLGYAPNNHPPFPTTITACLNHELVHGIARADVILKEGDIVSIDTACFYQGMVGDAAFTVAVGEVPPAVRRLIDVTEQALQAAIAASQVGKMVSDVARATESVASKNGYSVALEYTGHGVGRKMHEAPQVPNWWPSAKQRRNPRHSFQDYELVEGMTYAIEPMVIAGRNALEELKDGWTVVTKDRSLCAHCEHTIAITADGPQILTLL
ncbi:MAG: type I methionyl aminopeptidase [Anaerolineae bacterium]|nr:type I methionyl aminopeptidase [Anaerolineae bacterium]MDW8173821.1 type I methionyl aminopeptidase [Anaerolineae bacterium]